MASFDLQTNEPGDVKLCPITDFKVQLATNDMVVVTIEYVESVEQFDSGERKEFRTVVPAERALALGATLKKAARLILESNSPNLN
jgi:hypothetical protein